MKRWPLKEQPGRFDFLEFKEMEPFQKLNAALLHPSVLASLKSGLSYTLDTESLDAQNGCCFFQEQGNEYKLQIGYRSRALFQTEQNYTVTEKECLAAVQTKIMLRACL